MLQTPHLSTGSRKVCFVSLGPAVLLSCAFSVYAAEPAVAGKDVSAGSEKPARAASEKPARAASATPPLAWLSDYGRATDTAVRQKKLLLILFRKPGSCPLGDRLESETLADPDVRRKMSQLVALKLPLDHKLPEDGKEIELVRHAAFAEMEGLPGLAIVDFAHSDPNLYGYVVSQLPFLDERVFSLEEMNVILDLPPGTLTQRTLIFAVRTHPERPASTQGRFDPALASEAQSHADYQARILRQGHHFWETRFHRINSRLGSGLMAKEVCAESWPGEGLLRAARECVRCWRTSSGHWSAVQAQCPAYGYDMKRGANGIWYATGIVAR